MKKRSLFFVFVCLFLNSFFVLYGMKKIIEHDEGGKVCKLSLNNGSMLEDLPNELLLYMSQFLEKKRFADARLINKRFCELLGHQITTIRVEDFRERIFKGIGNGSYLDLGRVKGLTESLIENAKKFDKVMLIHSHRGLIFRKRYAFFSDKREDIKQRVYDVFKKFYPDNSSFCVACKECCGAIMVIGIGYGIAIPGCAVGILSPFQAFLFMLCGVPVFGFIYQHLVNKYKEKIKNEKEKKLIRAIYSEDELKEKKNK